MRIYVEYDKNNPDLVRVQHRNAALAIIPAGSIAVVGWLIAGAVLMALTFFERRLVAQASDEQTVQPVVVLKIDLLLGFEVVNRWRSGGYRINADERPVVVVRHLLDGDVAGGVAVADSARDVARACRRLRRSSPFSPLVAVPPGSWCAHSSLTNRWNSGPDASGLVGGLGRSDREEQCVGDPRRVAVGARSVQESQRAIRHGELTEIDVAQHVVARSRLAVLRSGRIAVRCTTRSAPVRRDSRRRCRSRPSLSASGGCFGVCMAVPVIWLVQPTAAMSSSRGHRHTCAGIRMSTALLCAQNTRMRDRGAFTASSAREICVSYPWRQPCRQPLMSPSWCARRDRRRVVPPECQRRHQLGASGDRASPPHRS